MMPGAEPSQVFRPDPDLPGIRDRLGAATDTVSALEEKLRRDYIGPLNEAKALAIPLQARVADLPGPNIREAIRFRDKIARKLRNDIGAKIENAYTFTSRLGFNVPTPADVNYGVTTGDYFGAFTGEGFKQEVRGGVPKPCPPDATGNQEWCLGQSQPPSGSPSLPPPSQPPAPPPPQPPTTTPPPSPLPPAPPAQPPLPPPSPPPGTGTGTGSVPVRPGDEEEAGSGEPVIPPEFAPGGGLQCPAGYHLVDLGDGAPFCEKDQAPGPPTIPPGPGGEIPSPAPEQPQPPPAPPGPAPIQIDPTSCTYPKQPTTKLKCGKAGPPAPKPAPYWLETWCDGCGWEWCIWQGHDKPSVPDGHAIYGPFAEEPNPATYIQTVCKVQTEGEEEEEEEEPEDEVPPEEEGEEEGEEQGEEEEEEQDDGGAQVPPAEDRPLPENTDACKFVKELAVFIAGSPDPWLEFLQQQGAAPKETTLIGAIEKIANKLLPFGNIPFADLLPAAKEFITNAIKKGSKVTGCDLANFIPLAIYGGIVKLVNTYVPVFPPQLLERIAQVMNSACQVGLPTGADADAAYLTFDINRETWECWHKAQGDTIPDFEKVFKSKRTKPNASQYDLLFRRKYIGKADRDRLMREAGVLEERDRKHLAQLNDQWPGVADCVRFMVRDTADPAAVAKYDLDKDFLKKWQGRLKDLTEALGIPEEVMRYYWRAHWDIPSYTQLSTMVHRLRPGRAPAGTETTITDVREALQINDMLPYWIDRMIAITYHPVNPSDAVKAYYIHAYDEEKLKEVLKDNGYSDDTAGEYITFLRKDRERRDKAASGYPSVRQLVNLRARCVMTNGQFRDTLAKIAISEEQERAAVDAGELMVKVRAQERGIKATRRPFMLGLIDAGQAAERLHRAGIDSDCVSELIELWSGEMARRDKYLSAGQLCKMRERNIIGAAEQAESLIRQGWSREDAMRITQLCGAEISERNIRRAEAEARRRAADAEKAAKQAEKLRRLAQCGPPGCPKNTPGGQKPQQPKPANPSPPEADTGANTRPAG